MPQLSVLMPAKDAGRYVEQSVAAALNAMPADSELIVVNDGSTDNTSETLHRVADKRLRIIDQPVSRGVVEASNLLLSNTDSEFVARIDADDICIGKRFERQLKSIEGNDIVFSRIAYINEFGENRGTERFPGLRASVVPLHLLLGNVLSNPTMLARRESLVSLGGFRNATSEDYDLWMRAAAEGLRLKKTFTPLVRYRIHPAQATASRAWQAKVVDATLLSSYSTLCEKLLGIFPEFNDDAFPQISAPFLLLTAESQEVFNEAFERKIGSIDLYDRSILRLRKRLLEYVTHNAERRTP
jgi:glycosyltransferase involved in cell wall biosynthesis